MIENQTLKGRITVSKYDEETKTRLPGVEFTLYDEGMNELAAETTGSNGNAVFRDLELGTYYLKETKAAPGHKLPDEEVSKFVVTADQLHLTKVFYNEVQHLPVTGSAMTLILMSLSILFTAAGGFIIYKNRKRVTNRDEEPEGK